MIKGNIFKLIFKQSGQALLIVVLVMVVALTVGLSIASKSIISFRNSTEQASSQKALSAAEAGIEQALKSTKEEQISGIFTSTPNTITNYTTTRVAVGGNSGSNSFLLNGGNSVLQNSGIDLWLSYYSNTPANLFKNPLPPYEFTTYNGGFTVYWGDSSGACNNAAMEIVIITGASKAEAKLARYAFDPCANRRTSNKFTEVAATGPTPVSGKKFTYAATISSVVNGLVARVVPLYMSSVVGITGADLPAQGTLITSVGTSGSTQRRINVFQGYPELPAEYFLYNLYLP